MRTKTKVWYWFSIFFFISSGFFLLFYVAPMANVIIWFFLIMSIGLLWLLALAQFEDFTTRILEEKQE